MKETKTITLLVVGTGNPKAEDVGIVKGTTTEDLKRVAPSLKKKTEYTFVRKATGETLNKGVDLFEILEDHEKVDASPTAELGGVREAISRIFSFFPEGQEPTIPVAYPSCPPQYEQPPIVARPVEQLGIEAQLEEFGWTASGNGHFGHICYAGNFYEGQIVRTWSGYSLYIHNPPTCVFNGRHRDCFVPQGDGWCFVHFVSGTGNPISMVREAERYMAESRSAF